MYNAYNTGNIYEIKYDYYGMKHCLKKIILIFATAIVFIITIVFNGLASTSSTLFKTPTGKVSDKFPSEFTPPGWVFIIWAFIYTWQGIWLFYSLISIFRKSSSGYRVYLKPDFLNNGIFVFYIVNLLANITWLFLWGYEHLGWALLFLLIITFSLYGSLVVSYRKLYENLESLKQDNLTVDIWLTRLFIQNGITFYATWVSIASILNFVIYITWRLGASNTNATTGGLSIVLFIIIVYSILENFIWPKYLLYTFSQWIVVIVAFIGIVTKQWNNDAPTRNNIISLTVLCLAGFCTLLKIVFFILYKTVLKHRIK